MSFASFEKALFIFLAIASYIFSVIDSLFFGYYMWIYFGPHFFLLYFFCSVPFVFINRANGYAQMCSNIPLFDYNAALDKIAASPLTSAIQMALFMLLAYLTYNLYIVYYGSWLMQILKLLRNKLGFGGIKWLKVLVLISLVPEAVSFCVGLFNDIRVIVADIKKMSFSGIKPLADNIMYAILVLVAVLGAIVSAQISASYIMLTYQHYLMEFYKVSVPVVKGKLIILGMIFLDMFFTLKQFLISVTRSYGKEDLDKVKHNYYSYIVLCFTLFIKAISRIILAVGIATSPWHINIKVSTFMQSIFEDFLSINKSNNKYTVLVINLALFFSLFNLLCYMALICEGNIAISLSYGVISVSMALLLSFITPIAMYNTNNAVSNDDIFKQKDLYVNAKTFSKPEVAVVPIVKSGMDKIAGFFKSYARCL